MSLDHEHPHAIDNDAAQLNPCRVEKGPGTRKLSAVDKVFTHRTLTVNDNDSSCPKSRAVRNVPSTKKSETDDSIPGFATLVASNSVSHHVSLWDVSTTSSLKEFSAARGTPRRTLPMIVESKMVHEKCLRAGSDFELKKFRTKSEIPAQHIPGINEKVTGQATTRKRSGALK